MVGTDPRVDRAMTAKFYDAVLLDESSVRHYLDVMIEEYEAQEALHARNGELTLMHRAHGRAVAYVDALRVIEIAVDSANHAAERMFHAIAVSHCGDHFLGTDHYVCQTCRSPMDRTVADRILKEAL
jgi:hypothetical protein